MDLTEETWRVILPTCTDTLLSQLNTAQAILHVDAFQIDTDQTQVQWQAILKAGRWL